MKSYSLKTLFQMLQDELSALSLELNQVELRNDNLKRDNASLLQRWLDRMNDEAEKMNEGNRFLQEVEQRKGSKEDPVPTTPVE
jgi:cob(I)alamin adenosyltransferase